ncbi:MAG TPA: response regulator [Polyangiales bacterium]|jgi:two-component system cell cycle sensor histidine kinase/response regulator CckA|nr:response regulator [Polyangiales bacterium]
MRVLVVEDDAHARDALTSKLRERGHTVIECITGEQALALHAAHPFPLVLIDWVLPGMDGLGLCRKLRGMPNSAGMSPVIVFTTGRSGPYDLVRGLDAGADDYLTKPIDSELLSTRLAIAERMVDERERRVSSESALQRTEAGFRALIEGSPDGIVVHRAGRIVYVNPSLRTALGYESDALTGHEFLRLVHPADAEVERERLAQLGSSGRPTLPHEIRLQRRDGTSVVFEDVSIPLQFEGKPSVASLLRDLSERKRMEQRLLLADRMVSVGTLAAGIAHEINNPLAYVLANLSFIQEEVEEVALTLPEAKLKSLRELLAQAEDGAERVRIIIRDLKSFSRADAEDDGPVDVQRVLDGAINMAWNEIRHRAQLDKRCDHVPAVRGSEARLGQVFLNLLVNAAQAIPVGHAGENRISVSVRQKEERVVIEVSDTGCGIPQDIMARIFDPFFTTKPVGVGTGLGLSICHNIVASVGGEISVDSTVGRGSTFRISLPIARVVSMRPRTQPSLPVQAAGRRLRIMLVDDEPSVVRALQRALREHELVVAFSGTEALEVLDSGQVFDIVFCDLMMAQLSGMEVYETVRRRYPGVQEHFVFMTGGAFTQQAKDFLASVPNPIVEKPFDIRALRALVSRRNAA